MALLTMGVTTLVSGAKRDPVYYDPFKGETVDMVKEDNRITQKLERTNGGDSSFRNARLDTSFVPHNHKNPSYYMFDLEKLYNKFFKEEDTQTKRFQRNLKKFKAKNGLENVSNMQNNKTYKRNASRRSRLQQATNPQIELTNVYNTMYHAPVYVGSDNQKLSVVYDTGSDWLVLEDSECESCFGQNFNTTTSSSFNQLSDIVEDRLYGSAALQGTRVTDKVCLNADNEECVPIFEWFLIESQTGLPSDIDGILGMCLGLPIDGIDY